MSRFLRFLAQLFEPPQTRLEDIVFERLDDAEGASAVPSPVQAGVEISLGELTPLVPAAWLRSGGFSLERIVFLPAESFLEASAERPAAVSLRFLAAAFPEAFKDPGASYPDPGVDVPMAMLRDPAGGEGGGVALPPELLQETEIQREAFTVWEGDAVAGVRDAGEARETAAALRGVRLPRTLPAERGTAFEEALAGQTEGTSPALVERPEGPGSMESQESGREAEAAGRHWPSLSGEPGGSAGVGGGLALAPQKPVPSNRIRKILEAYAETLPGVGGGEAPAPGLSKTSLTSFAGSSGAPLGEAGMGQLGHGALSREAVSDLAFSSVGNPQGVGGGERGGGGFPVQEGGGAVEGYQMRFEELGLSLSRFPEVKGFAFWQSGRAAHTGDLGVDLELGALRVRVERLLEGAVQLQGAQDGFSSCTVHHARGGMSVFGSGSVLVAVAHQHEGIPSHLRAWMCGWVSQPLR